MQSCFIGITNNITIERNNNLHHRENRLEYRQTLNNTCFLIITLIKQMILHKFGVSKAPFLFNFIRNRNTRIMQRLIRMVYWGKMTMNYEASEKGYVGGYSRS